MCDKPFYSAYVHGCFCGLINFKHCRLSFLSLKDIVCAIVFSRRYAPTSDFHSVIVSGVLPSFPQGSMPMQYKKTPMAHLSPSVKPYLPPAVKTEARSPTKAHTSTQNGSSQGPQKAGVGIFFQQEASENIYVSSMVPGGAAERDGGIRMYDQLVCFISILMDTCSTI